MEATKLDKSLNVGDHIYFDNCWCIVSNIVEGEVELLTIEVTPRALFAREGGIDLFAAQSEVHGLAPRPINCTPICDVMDTVFIIYYQFVGNRQEVVIDWGYYIGANKDSVLITDKNVDSYKNVGEQFPVKKAFYYDELRLRNERLEQYFENARNSVKI